MNYNEKEKKGKGEMSERHWPEELVLEIFLRLPAKSIGKFRCVSKFWCKSLTDSKFVKNHLIQSKQSYKEQILITTKFGVQFDLHLVTSYNDKLGVETELHHPVPTSDTKFVYVLGSCNGILCLIYPDKMIYLWNPCIGEFKKLPNSLFSNSPCSTDNWIGVSFGFGYNSVVDDYETLRIAYVNNRYSIAYVYSLKKNFCRQIKDIPYITYNRNKSGKLVNGALHWLGAPGGSTRPWFKADYRLVLAYDIGGERFREVPQPDYKDKGFKMEVAEFRYQLCLCCRYKERIDVWVMKEYNVRGSWVKLFDVKHVAPYIGYQLALHYTRNGSILLFMGNDLGLYDPKTKSQICLKIGGDKRVIYATTFMESLVRPNLKG